MDNKNFKEDDYLVTSKYAGRDRSDQFTDFCAFEYEESYYFAWIDDAGAVAMRSEAYKTPSARDNGIQSVLKNRSNSERWSISEFSSRYFLTLKAGNNQEIAKSPALSSKEEAETYLAKLLALSKGEIAAKAGLGIAGGVITGKIISETRNLIREDRKVLNETRKDLGEKSRKQIGETRNQIGESRKQIGVNRRALKTTQMASKADDYLPCSEYKNHKVTDKKNNVSLFKHKNGQLYFAIYNDDGSVRLRSEGFQSAEARQMELTEALKYINDNSRYESIDKGEYHIKVLTNEAGQEVGRTCLQGGAAGLMAGGMLAVSAMSKAGFVAPKKKEKVAYLAGNGGCLKFWPLLLLLPLLWFCWKGCGVVPPPAAPVVVEKVVPPPVKKVVPPPVVPKTCDCSKLTHPIFVIPDGPPPKETTILGRAPEYGNSHALNAAGFYNKLKNKYSSSAFEKDFLNGIFKQMGYENGFQDATADLFSEVTVPRGVDGNLGTKTTHKTVYRKLNTNGKDLLAFRIKAKNACDLHFMKTCGNHFFYNECRE